MIIHHAMISCPRPVNYISETLASFMVQWPGEITNVYEEPGHIGYQHSNVAKRHIHEKKLGCVENWLFAVSDCLKHHWDYLIITEDDIYWRLDSAREIKDFLSRGLDFGYASAYCAMVNQPDGLGWQKTNLRAFGQCGALCLIFPRKSIEKLVYDPTYFHIKSEGKHLDTAIGYYFEEQRNYTYYPTLILHNGEISCSEATNKIVSHYKQTREPAL